MKRVTLLLACVLACLPAFGQWTTVTASKVADGSDPSKKLNGKVCMTGTDATGKPVPYQIGGDGQAVETAFCAPVTGGVFGSLMVPDSQLTAPKVCYRLALTNRNGLGRTDLICQDLSGNDGVTGTTWSYDSYVPSTSILSNGQSVTNLAVDSLTVQHCYGPGCGSGDGSSYSFTAPLSLTGSTVSVPKADATHNGYLSSGDWSTFNGKQSALGFTPEQQLTFSAPLSRAVNTISLDLSGYAQTSALPQSKTCTGTDKFGAYDASTHQFTCSADQLGTSGGGITSLNSSSQSSQTFVAGANIGISTNTGTGAHTFSVTGLASVATSGAYGDLSGKPDLSVYATNTALSSEASTARAAESANASAISTETTRATNAESALTTAVNGKQASGTYMTGVTGPLQVTSGTLVSCPNATDSVSGCLTSTDHAAFVAKADASALTAHTGNTSNPHSVTKQQVGLGSVDNTADASKPISTLQQAALDTKVSKTGDETIAGNKTFTGTLAASTMVLNGTDLATRLTTDETAITAAANAASAAQTTANAAVPNTRTINGHALSSNVTVTAGDLGLNTASTATASGSKCYPYTGSGGAGCDTPTSTIPAQPFVYVPTFNGSPGSSTVLVRAAVGFTTSLPANCQDATHFTYFVAENVPTADATFVIQRCTNTSNTSWSCSNIGSGIIRAGKISSVTSDITCTATTLNAGDMVKVLAPSSVDSTMANFGGAIYATR